MENLSNELLIKAYIESIKHGLEEEFQILLKEEILRRKLEIYHAVQNNLHNSKQTGENMTLKISKSTRTN